MQTFDVGDANIEVFQCMNPSSALGMLLFTSLVAEAFSNFDSTSTP